ncbi:hypothetical protein Q3G72_016134 [Acer saccharum]|nr:hypothetical protein Q3G72_030584 [Acer saccharum]KAK1572934.1 hypothetical protein Q3G72_016134 [Acer saccharum]
MAAFSFRYDSRNRLSRPKDRTRKTKTDNHNRGAICSLSQPTLTFRLLTVFHLLSNSFVPLLDPIFSNRRQSTAPYSIGGEELIFQRVKALKEVANFQGASLFMSLSGQVSGVCPEQEKGCR